MDLEVEVEQELLQRIATVARRSQCPGFCDLVGWGEQTTDFVDLLNNPGVMFESSIRVVVFQWVVGELRYYAGGWCRDQINAIEEQDRVQAEGCELGQFPTVRDAVLFTKEYLVDGWGFQTIGVPRQVRFNRSALKP